VSGNAHGLLGVYLTRLGLLEPNTAGERTSFCGLQGHYLQRPGRVTVELEMRDGAVEAVWIVGQAISIFETVISL
jgi:predicted PhzF superfamily epimerase YddE/YHI9